MGTIGGAVHDVGMQGYITQIATTAAGFLPGLVLIGVVAVVMTLLMTGPGGRIAVRIEDLLYRRRLERAGSRTA